MPETSAFTIKASPKPLIPHMTLASLLLIGAGVWIGVYQGSMWWLALPVLYDIYVCAQFVESRSRKLIVDGDKLRFESGLLTKQTRTIPLGKIQDVGVQQSMMQRMFGIGAISIAAAGDANRLVMENVADPTAVCDRIMQAIPKH